MNRKQQTFLRLRHPWSDNPNNIWLASILELSRNLRPHLFPGKLSVDGRLQVRAMLAERLLGNVGLDHPTFIKAEEAGPLEKEFLYEHFLSPAPFQQAISGEGFVVDNQGDFFAMINVYNHLHLQITDVHEQIEETWHRLVNIETDLNTQLEYSYSPRFGYLTSDPMQCGTALQARLYLHTPALIRAGKLESTLANLQGEEIVVSSILGGLDHVVGDILAIQNRCSIGVTEEHILEMLRAFALKMMLAEKRERSRLQGGQAFDMKDLVSRAYGLAVHSYQLEAIEAWGALSLLKLGVDLGWITGTNHKELNELIFDCRRAHLTCNYSEDITQEELPHRRADFIHASLTNAHLKI
ncbi:MAG: protein arginine kinase [Verrucomicrobia bacterium]|nr:protein arginine kinase [Verrucomicrobiota bacterium]